MSERFTTDNLPNGTLEKLEKRAIKKGFVKLNGKANMAAYARDLFTKEAEKVK